MEGLLKKYLEKEYQNYTVFIDHYTVDGSTCIVHYYMDESRYYREYSTINIWDMLAFLNQKEEK